ncbi:MAG: NUDIX domain-containing protein [Candidatus Nanoarchaeia archaeon]
MNTKNNIRVGVIIIENNKLLVTRINKNNKYTYVLPGGSLEAREDMFQAVIREVKEETHLTIDIENLKLKFIKELYTDEDEHGIEFIFIANTYGGELKLGHDPEYIDNPVLDEVKFVDLNELDTINFHPKQIIPYLLKNNLDNLTKDIIHLGLFKYPE